MSKIVLAVAFVAAVVLSACSPAFANPSPSPSGTPAPSEPTAPSEAPRSQDPPAASPSPVATPTPTPDATPRPTPAPVATPREPIGYTDDEQYLIDGIMRGAVGCEPIRDELPARAIAGIECTTDDPDVDRVGFYLFENDKQMLDHYVARMAAEGVGIESGNCRDGEHESAYIPGAGDDLNPYRHGCFIDADGDANFRATLPGAHVYIGVVGRVEDMYAVERFAWLGNEDTPGGPSLWADPRGS